MLLSVLPLTGLQLTLIAFGFGAIIGSFLNVVIYRFHTGKSLTGSSHCMSCATPLKWYELFPVFSYLALRGRCRTCGSNFTSRYVLVEVLTGVLFVAAAYSASSLYELVLLSLIMSILVVITVYDLRHFIIPDKLTLLLTVATILYVFPVYILTESYTALGTEVGAAFLGSLFLFALWAVSKGKWLGFGDVKLAFPLGLLVGSGLVFSFIVWSFWIGAGVSVFLVLVAELGRGKLRLPFIPSTLTIKSAVPFAPFLVAGALLVFFFKLNVLTLFTI